jgi:hypothetical protein
MLLILDKSPNYLLRHHLVKIYNKAAFSFYLISLFLSFLSSFLGLARITLHFLRQWLRFGDCLFKQGTNANPVSNYQTTEPLSQRPMCASIISCAELRPSFTLHWSLLSSETTHERAFVSALTNACCMSRPSHLPCSDNRWTALPFVTFAPSCCHLFSVRSIYSP